MGWICIACMLQHPFAKAAYMMLMISEGHPFLDGNGRMARVMMNAELSSKGLSKIIIPTVYREDYSSALKKLTMQMDAEAYIRMMLRAWEFSSHVHHETLDAMEEYLLACNAFLTLMIYKSIQAKNKANAYKSHVWLKW